MLRCISLIFLICVGSFASQNKEFTNLKTELSTLKSSMRSINTNLADMNQKINFKNEKYVSFLKSERKVFSEIERRADQLDDYDEKIYTLKNKIKSLYLQTIALENEEVSEEIFIFQKQRESELSKSLETLVFLESKLKRAKEDYQRIKSDLADISKEKKFVHTILLDLETKKNFLLNDYESNIAKTKVSEYTLKMMKQRIKKIESVAKIKVKNFILPIKNVSKITEKLKGINLFYEGDVAIYAPADGEVIYLSELSSYGKIIILKHQNNYRSVLLGDLNFQVSLGDKVTQGDVMAYAKNSSEKLNKLYLEMRQDEVNMNVSQFFDLTKKI